MIFGLRRYDLDRCAALIDMSDPANKDKPVIGFISHKGKIYLVRSSSSPVFACSIDQYTTFRLMFTTTWTTS
jgi:hypothetical protein